MSAVSSETRLEVAVSKLRQIRARLEAVYDRAYPPGDTVQGVLDLVVTNDLPFLIEFLDGCNPKGETSLLNEATPAPRKARAASNEGDSDSYGKTYPT